MKLRLPAVNNLILQSTGMMENISMISATHVTLYESLPESDASELIARLNNKSLNAHFSVHYAHFSKTDGCFGSVSNAKRFRYQFAVYFGV